MSRAVFLPVLICVSACLAQTNKGRISGTVFDKQGAVIPGATITVTNTGTSESIKLTSSESGTYSAPLLDPVTYRLTVAAPGFKKAHIENVKVDTAEIATV